MATSSTSSGQICQDGCNTGRSCDGGSCESGWVSMSAPPAGFVARQRAAATAFDGKVFIFGGVDANGNLLDSGAVYGHHDQKARLQLARLAEALRAP